MCCYFILTAIRRKALETTAAGAGGGAAGEAAAHVWLIEMLEVEPTVSAVPATSKTINCITAQVNNTPGLWTGGTRNIYGCILISIALSLMAVTVLVFLYLSVVS